MFSVLCSVIAIREERAAQKLPDPSSLQGKEDKTSESDIESKQHDSEHCDKEDDPVTHFEASDRMEEKEDYIPAQITSGMTPHHNRDGR